MTQRKIEVFTAGCLTCDDLLQAIREAGCASCEVEVLPMAHPENAAVARELGIRHLPAVAIDGKLADCCVTGGVDLDRLRELGLGQPRA